MPRPSSAGNASHTGGTSVVLVQKPEPALGAAAFTASLSKASSASRPSLDRIFRPKPVQLAPATETTPPPRRPSSAPIARSAEAVDHRAVEARQTTAPRVAPEALEDPASSGSCTSQRQLWKPADSGLRPSSSCQRPQSAHAGVVSGAGRCTRSEKTRAAGKRSEGHPWDLADRKSSAPRAFSCANAHVQGWKVKSVQDSEQVLHDPILHKVEVFVRHGRGPIERCNPSRQQYHDALGRAASMKNRGRRKGVSEFEDLVALGAPNWDPAHKEAFEHDCRAFHRQRGEFASYCDIAGKRWPNSPPPFEATRMKGKDAQPGGPVKTPSRQRPASAQGRVRCPPPGRGISKMKEITAPPSRTSAPQAVAADPQPSAS